MDSSSCACDVACHSPSREVVRVMGFDGKMTGCCRLSPDTHSDFVPVAAVSEVQRVWLRGAGVELRVLTDISVACVESVLTRHLLVHDPCGRPAPRLSGGHRRWKHRGHLEEVLPQPSSCQTGNKFGNITSPVAGAGKIFPFFTAGRVHPFQVVASLLV